MALTHADLQEYIATHGREVLRTLCSLLLISRHLFPTARTPHNPLRRTRRVGRLAALAHTNMPGANAFSGSTHTVQFSDPLSMIPLT